MCVCDSTDPREQREQGDQRHQRQETWNTIDPNKIPKLSKVRPAVRGCEEYCIQEEAAHAPII